MAWQCRPSTMDTTKSVTQVLYNNSYGDGFEFSKIFLVELMKRRDGKDSDTTKTLFLKGKGGIRCDPVAIALFKEKGSEWCSGPTSSLELREFSSVFENYWEIEEQDGNEYVRVKLAEALADTLHTFIQTDDVQALYNQYTTIMMAATSLNKSIDGLPATVSGEELKKERGDVITHVGHTY